MIRSAAPHKGKVGAVLSGRRFSSLVLPIGLKMRAADRAVGEIGAVEPRLRYQLVRRQHPVEMRIDHAMAALAAGKAGQGRDNDRALLRQRVQVRDPARQPAKTGEKAKLRAAALL